MKKVAALIDGVEKVLLTYPFLLLGCCIVFEVFSRKITGQGLSWLQEMGKYLIGYGTFIGASVAVKNRSHPSMTALRDILPWQGKLACSVLANVICAVGMGMVAYYSWIQLATHIRVGTLTSSLWGMPISVPFAVMPICATIMSLRFFLQLYLEPKELVEAHRRKEAA